MANLPPYAAWWVLFLNERFFITLFHESPWTLSRRSTASQLTVGCPCDLSVLFYVFQWSNVVSKLHGTSLALISFLDRVRGGNVQRGIVVRRSTAAIPARLLEIRLVCIIEEKTTRIAPHAQVPYSALHEYSTSKA